MHCPPLGVFEWHKIEICSTSFSQNLPSFLHEIDPNECLCDVLELHYYKMSLIWREKEHEE